MTNLLGRFAGDRRLVPRHRIQIRLRVRMPGSAGPGNWAQSENLSKGGVFFASDLSLKIGERIELLLKMPREITGVRASEWLCTGQVVRVEKASSRRCQFGVGVKFYCYEASQAA